MLETKPVSEWKLSLFQDADFAGDLTDSKSTSDGMHCILGDILLSPFHGHAKKKTDGSVTQQHGN